MHRGGWQLSGALSRTPRAAATGTGGTTGAGDVEETGSGAEEVVTGGTETTGTETTGTETAGAGNTGTETSPADRGSERVCAVITSTVTVLPARARHPTAASRLGQDCRGLARCRGASPGSARASSGITAGGVGTSTCAALRGCLPAAASALIRSRRARSSSTVRIWPVSDSSTSRYV
jgi:hypothetical protein